MNADDDVRAPTFEQSSHVTDATFVEKLTRVWTNAVDDPVVILHPVLAVAENPVVETNQFVSEVMRFLDGAHDTNCVRLAVQKLLHSRDNRRCGRAMPAARVGRDDQYLRNALLSWHLDLSRF